MVRKTSTGVFASETQEHVVSPGHQREKNQDLGHWVESHRFDEEKYVERNKDFCVGRDADLT
jgi:hypothetical protein